MPTKARLYVQLTDDNQATEAVKTPRNPPGT